MAFRSTFAMGFPMFVHGRAGHIAIGTKHAAIAGLGFQDRPAALALVEILTEIGWHPFPLLVAAMRAGPVGKLRFMAVRAFHPRARLQELVGTPAIFSRFRMFSFRIRHCFPSFGRVLCVQDSISFQARER